MLAERDVLIIQSQVETEVQFVPAEDAPGSSLGDACRSPPVCGHLWVIFEINVSMKFFGFFGSAVCGLWNLNFPDQGLNQCPLQSKPGSSPAWTF